MVNTGYVTRALIFHGKQSRAQEELDDETWAQGTCPRTQLEMLTHNQEESESLRRSEKTTTPVTKVVFECFNKQFIR